MESSAANIKHYRRAVEFLNSLQVFGARFGLETMTRLAALAGNPQQQLRFLHVAGTNGKGSTCALLESIYRAAGLRTGLFTSPHLVSFRERIQVNRRLIPEADVARLVEEVRPVLKTFPDDQHPTFFEVVTWMALKYFAEQRCDIVIWETGLGGRLDATNIVTPLASVITNIGFDHQQWLGDTLAKIAAEKAGIIKPGVPVLTAEAKPEPLAVIEQTARERRAPLRKVEASSEFEVQGLTSLPGEHQRLNAALALATVEVLQKIIPVNESQLRRGLSEVTWAGRLQTVIRPSGQRVLLDGAHNAEGAETLRAALLGRTDSLPPSLILGILGDKNCQAMCRILAPLADRIWIVPVKSERTAAPEELAKLCRAENSRATVTVCASLSDALQQTANEPFVVVAGSLYLIGEALELLGLGPAQSRDEKGLNDWHRPTGPGSGSA
ncbi:MAG: folylpolyglutamate synthase/dihydrofolate synthase family protein [Verrucomicrobiota bacterium]